MEYPTFIRHLARKIYVLGHKQVANEAVRKGIPIETFLLAMSLARKS